MYFAFIDLEKAFDRVPRKVIWWVMRTFGVEEWAIRVVQGMYKDAKSRVRISGKYSENFNVNVGVHQGSAPSPLLFIIVLEALSREFRKGVPWELLYTDDLGLIAESLEECISKFEAWKSGMESKGLRVNSKKTKFMVSGIGLGQLRHSGAFPCGVCRTGVGANSILCSQCSFWIHKICSGVMGRLSDNPEYPRCQGTTCPIDGRPINEVFVDEVKMDVVPSFCYLGDMLSAGGGCDLAVTTRCSVAWGKFRKLLPILTSKHVSLKTRGKLFSSCVRSAMLHGSETWAPPVSVLQRLQRNDRSMIRWICNTRARDRAPTSELLAKLGIVDITLPLSAHRLRWFGHVQRAPTCIKIVCDLLVAGRRRRGRPMKSWMICVEKDIKHCNLSQVNPMNRVDWRRASRLLLTPAAGTQAAV